MRRRRRVNYRRLYPLFSGLFIAVIVFTFLAGHNPVVTEAANLSKFDPGYIISDYTMGNYNSMTEEEIQAFLTRKNPCANTDYQLYQSSTAAYPNITWHWKDGHFVCLSEELFGDGMVIGEGETAAHIIYQAAQDYKINPQVILVLLQKESSLITDSYPNSLNYRAATGYGCPDTAPCDAKYYGLKNQIRKAAALFREVLDGGWSNYHVGNNYVKYNPNASCGGTVVDIKNLATASLYRYTPYQPNAAAINANYGYGDACSAYGNRNFYLYFYDWFGDPTSESRITEYYKLLGGQSSYLGEATRDEACGIVDNGCYRAFKNGRIYWKKSTGAWDISGEIYDYWYKLGTEWSDLGYPTSTKIELKDGGAFQKFENGRIYWKKSTGAWEVKYGKIYDAWYKLGTEWGELGYPTGSEQEDENGITYQQFEHGRIYLLEDDTWVVSDWAEKHYEAIGAANSKLGKSTKSGKCGITNNGCYQNYEHGRMYYTEATGAWEIEYGKIYDAWYKLGTEWSELGYPTGSEQEDKNGIVYQQFEHGRIYLLDNNTWVVPDWAEDRYEAAGAIKSVLKTPTNNGRCGLVNNGCYQNYEIGRMYYSPTTGAWDISGKIYAKWYELGTEWSDLGYPTSSEQKDKNDIVYQQFEHGRIYYRTGKTWVIPDWAEDHYESIGALDSNIQAPVSSGKCGLAQNGCFQKYENGRMYYSPTTGAWEIKYGKIYDTWYKLGTEWSELGYPISSEQEDEEGNIYQQFEHGKIYYSAGETRVVL